MNREKFIGVILTVAVIAGAGGFILGGVFARLDREELDAIRANTAERIAELTGKVAAAEKGRDAAIAETIRVRGQAKRVVSQNAKRLANRNPSIEVRPAARKKVPPHDDYLSAVAASVCRMIDDGDVYSVDVDLNQVRVDPDVWLQWSPGKKQYMVKFFSDYFDQSGNSGQVTILSSRNDMKLATGSGLSGVLSKVRILK